MYIISCQLQIKYEPFNLLKKNTMHICNGIWKKKLFRGAVVYNKFQIPILQVYDAQTQRTLCTVTLSESSKRACHNTSILSEASHPCSHYKMDSSAGACRCVRRGQSGRTCERNNSRWGWRPSYGPGGSHPLWTPRRYRLLDPLTGWPRGASCVHAHRERAAQSASPAITPLQPNNMARCGTNVEPLTI